MALLAAILPALFTLISVICLGLVALDWIAGQKQTGGDITGPAARGCGWLLAYLGILSGILAAIGWTWWFHVQ